MPNGEILQRRGAGEIVGARPWGTAAFGAEENRYSAARTRGHRVSRLLPSGRVSGNDVRANRESVRRHSRAREGSGVSTTALSTT